MDLVAELNLNGQSKNNLESVDVSHTSTHLTYAITDHWGIPKASSQEECRNFFALDYLCIYCQILPLQECEYWVFLQKPGLRSMTVLLLTDATFNICTRQIQYGQY